jgi:Ca-activated chloride channel homolog
MIAFDAVWMFLLVPFPLVLQFFLPAFKESRKAVFTPFFDQMAQMAGLSPERGAVVQAKKRHQIVLVASCWVLIVTALARPQWLFPPIVKTLPSRDLLVAVDLSGSMSTADFTDKNGNTVDRLTAVKEVLDTFFTLRQQDRIGMIFFGSAAFVQAPFTDDLDALRILLDEAQVRMAGPRTMLGDAIGLSISLFKKSQMVEKVLILLTDGNDTGSQLPPEKAADIARDNGITIFTVAMGDPVAVGEEKLDEATLRAIAQKTGGQYFWAGDRNELEEIYTQLDQLTPLKHQTIRYRPKQDLYFWPLGAMFLLSLVYNLFRILKGRDHDSAAE